MPESSSSSQKSFLSSRLSSSYLSATTSLGTQKSQAPMINGGVQRTGRSRGRSSPPKFSPYEYSSKPKAFFLKHDIALDLTKDKSVQKSLASAEAYALARVQEEFEVACVARSGIRAEELHALQRLGDGTMQIQCMKEEVADVRSRLEIADRQVARLRRKLHSKGVIAREHDDDREYSLGVGWKPVYTIPPSAFRSSSSHSSFTSSLKELHPSPTLARLEPSAKLDVVLWSSATHPVPSFEIPLAFRATNVPSPSLSTKSDDIEVLGETGGELSKLSVDESITSSRAVV